MAKFQTLFSSVRPVDCHILKSRLETEGIRCFIYDENLVWTFPFYANAVGWVKLKVAENQYEYAVKIMELLKLGKLRTGVEEYKIADVFTDAVEKEYAAFDLKYRLRKSPDLLEPSQVQYSNKLSEEDVLEIIAEEGVFQENRRKKFHFAWSDFWAELFDLERSVFRYLRPLPPEYYIDKDLVNIYSETTYSQTDKCCPKCKSTDIRRGYAMDYKWDIPYLIFALLIIFMAPPIRKKYHCFDCGADFRKPDISTQ